MAVASLENLLLDELSDLLSAEKQITKALPKKVEPAVMDAALIAAAQKMEHYEIASYGSARTWAEEVGQPKVAELLQATLDEEAETDRKLSQLAEALVNQRAA